MNYRHIYMCIITHAKASNRKRGDGNYYEKHHILPRSLFPNWITKESNTVLLTAREHFFCHQLLTKIYPSFEMEKALSQNPTGSSLKATRILEINPNHELFNAIEKAYESSKEDLDKL